VPVRLSSTEFTRVRFTGRSSNLIPLNAKPGVVKFSVGGPIGMPWKGSKVQGGMKFGLKDAGCGRDKKEAEELESSPRGATGCFHISSARGGSAN